jgi:hypothetical protein
VSLFLWSGYTRLVKVHTSAVHHSQLRSMCRPFGHSAAPAQTSEDQDSSKRQGAVAHARGQWERPTRFVTLSDPVDACCRMVVPSDGCVSRWVDPPSSGSRGSKQQRRDARSNKQSEPSKAAKQRYQKTAKNVFPVIFVTFFSQNLWEELGGRSNVCDVFFFFLGGRDVFFSQFLQPESGRSLAHQKLDPRDTTPYQNAHHTAIRSGLSLPILLMIPARFLSQLAFLELKAKSELDANKSARPMEEPCCALGFECIS